MGKRITLLLISCLLIASLLLLLYLRHNSLAPFNKHQVLKQNYYSIDKTIPQYSQIVEILNKAGFKESKSISNERPDILISANTSNDSFKLTDDGIVSNEVYALVNDFKDQQTSLSKDQLNMAFKQGKVFVNSANTKSLFTNSIQLSQNANLPYLNNSDTFEIIPLEQVTNKLHVVPVDNISPFDKPLSPNYALSISYHLFADSSISHTLKNELLATYTTNYDATKIHSIIMTGTTAFGRGEYFKIKEHGADYPAIFVKPIFAGADLIHISNETSFDPQCTQQIGTLQFCAPMEALQTMQYAGVNLVELTGNHNNDFGSQYNLQTQMIYQKNGINFFGGGANIQEANMIKYIKIGNETVAFLGYNQPGPSYAFATNEDAGAAKLDTTTMVNAIKQAKKNADIVFVDIQWENENNLYPDTFQTESARMAIDAGATVVTGSQAHRPQGMEFYNNGTIFYGLGNLFFDQMENLDTRQGIIVKHIIYGNSIVQTELIPTLLYDYSQPRPVVGNDASAIFNQIWQASQGIY